MADDMTNVQKMVEAGVLDVQSMTEAQNDALNSLTDDEVQAVIKVRNLLGSKHPLKPSSDGGFF